MQEEASQRRKTVPGSLADHSKPQRKGAISVLSSIGAAGLVVRAEPGLPEVGGEQEVFNRARNNPSHSCSPSLSLCALLHSLGSICFVCAGITLNWAINDREMGQRHPSLWDVSPKGGLCVPKICSGDVMEVLCGWAPQLGQGDGMGRAGDVDC